MIVDIDEMGPESAKSHPGKRLVPGVVDGPHGPHEGRATQEIDYGRRGKGYGFGALREATGEVRTADYPGRTSANFVEFLCQVDAWLEPELGRVFAIMDNLSTHRTPDGLLFSAQHPRWEFVFQPKYAAYLNLIESWWKILRSLALKGRRFESGTRSCTRSAPPPRIGMRIAIPSAGAVAAIAASRAVLASPPCHLWLRLARWTT